jgi:hypothetical protein
VTIENPTMEQTTEKWGAHVDEHRDEEPAAPENEADDGPDQEHTHVVLNVYSPDGYCRHASVMIPQELTTPRSILEAIAEVKDAVSERYLSETFGSDR